MLGTAVFGMDMENISLVPKSHPGKSLYNGAGMRQGWTYRYTVMSVCLECSGACNSIKVTIVQVLT